MKLDRYPCPNVYQNLKTVGCLLLLATLAWAGGPPCAQAQTDTLKKAVPAEEEVEDYSAYGDDTSVKRFCTQKVQFLAPTKLISVGYEVQGAHRLSNVNERYRQIGLAHGLRLAFNAPVISRSSLIVNLGASYYETKLQFESVPTQAFSQSLEARGLRTAGLMLTVFKPLNEKSFLIGAVNADLNGNYGWNSLPGLGQLRYSALAVYGWKRNDRTMWGLGLSRTYRIGEVNYIPVLLLNKTFNDRWGVEALLPARGHVRRTFSAKSLAMFGYELEGNSYTLAVTQTAPLGPTVFDRELRRSELKVRFVYERSLYNFIWVSVQAGLRVNMNFNVSETERSPRGEYVLTNQLGNPFYFGFSLNLVSP
jgi:hypothetical protein